MKALIRNYIALPFALASAFIHADRLGIHNQTPRDLHMGIYYLRMKLPWESEYPKATLASNIQFIEAESFGTIERPSRKVGYDRELVFVEDKNLLKPELTKDDLAKYHSKNVGDLQGDVFYIGDKEAEFYGYTTVEWNVAKPILEAARNKVISGLPAITENPYKGTTARVRVGNELSAGEKAFLQQRAPKVKAGFEKLLGKSLEGKYIPKVAMVCSGGGYRAMLFSTGALVGAENAGILNTVTYLVGLSGSTWAIGGWLLSGKPIRTYHDWLVNNVNYGLKRVSTDDVKLIGDGLLTKYYYDQPFDIVDLYGSFLANELFAEYDGRKQRQTLSNQAQLVGSGIVPFPIYTAIAAESIGSEGLWYEFTPHEVGASWLNAYVPSWSFGRRFKNGTSVNFAPEQNFGILMGTFGLAIGISLTRLIQEIGLKDKVNTLFVKNIIDRILQEHGERRITTSDFMNFSFEMPGNKMAAQRQLKLVDAGINFNLPYPPISGERPERTMDIIIFVDASGDNLAADLRHAESYARSHGLKFPAIDFTNIDKKAVSMFRNDADVQTPIVIYIPRILDRTLFSNPNMATLAKNFENIKNFDIEACIKSGPCSTFNFAYTSQQALQLTSLGALNMMAAKDIFIEASNWKIDHLSAPQKG